MRTLQAKKAATPEGGDAAPGEQPAPPAEEAPAA
jgi:hypothetical protein